MGFTGFLFTYLLGGVTFLPLLAIGIYYYSVKYLPEKEEVDENGEVMSKFDIADRKIFDQNQLNSDQIDPSARSPKELEKEADTGVDAYITGWLTVSREYFIYPNGGPKNSLNPPSAAANDANIHQSESAYSSLYKLMSNNSSSSKSLKNSTGSNSPSPSPSDTNLVETKNGSKKQQQQQQQQQQSGSKLNKYFAVLKHGNLFLYQDSDQSSVKHVIVIANHLVTMWPPSTNDGQLFIKRNAICLAKVDFENPDYSGQLSDAGSPPRNAFYLFSDNCSEKEDFYFALIRASKRSNIWKGKENSLPEAKLYDPSIMAHPLYYKTSEIMELIQTLHSTDANLQTRWLNALLGRLFLATKGTSKVESFFRNKIINKLSRVKRPTFLADIEVKRIYCGHAIPYFTNPKLRELTPEGLMVLEANVSYTGNFSIEIATKAILNLGARFKPRDVSLNLSAAVQHLEGKLIFKIKPPPSNRVWYAFETMPKLNLLIEPIVSSKQITYNVVTKAIENRIREVFKETLVLPFMDDLTFFGTEGEFYRGGIWDQSVRPPQQDDNEHTENIEENNEMINSRSTSIKSGLSNSNNGNETLRHRNKSFRPEDTTSSQTMIGPDLDSEIPPELRNRSSSNNSSDLRRDSLSSTSNKSSESSSDNLEDNGNNNEFDLKQHIGELKSFSSKRDLKRNSSDSNSPTKSKSSQSTLVGTVKKWGSWYFKDRMGNNKFNNNNPHSDDGDGGNHDDESIGNDEFDFENGTAIDDTGGDQQRRDREKSQSSTESKNSENSQRPKPAPEPHHFPPELINSLNDKSDTVINSVNPYSPTPEMKIPPVYPTASSNYQQPADVKQTSNKPPTKFAKRKPVGGGDYSTTNDSTSTLKSSTTSSTSKPDLNAYPPIKDPMMEIASNNDDGTVPNKNEGDGV